MVNKIIGTKYQTYIDDELVILRLVSIKNSDTFVMKNPKDPDVKIIMNSKQLEDLIALQPDAIINFATTSSSEDNSIDDVYVFVNKYEDIINKKNMTPVLILRQNLYSQLKNSFLLNEDNKIMLGECQSIKTLSTEELLGIMEFKSIIDKFSIASYIDDKLDDVIECIGKYVKPFNNALLEIKKGFIGNANIGGLSETLKDLLIDNLFMENYRLLFNISTVDIPIELDGVEYNEELIPLNDKQKKYIEDLLKQYIGDIKVLRYDKDIDISKIVRKTHLVVCDVNEKIYLITYIINGFYNTDDEAKNAMLNLIK